MTLVSSGNAASFVAAMKDFGPTQIMPVTEHPSLFKFWEWGRTYQPNRQPMLHWAQSRLWLCTTEAKDCSSSVDAHIDLRGDMERLPVWPRQRAPVRAGAVWLDQGGRITSGTLASAWSS